MKSISHTTSLIIIATILLAGSLWLSACATAGQAQQPPQPTNAPISMPTATTEALPEPVATSDPVANETSPQISIDVTKVAASMQSESMAAVSTGDNLPYWLMLPAYTRLTLEGYPITNHVDIANNQQQPQIFVYPVKELSEVNPTASEVIASLQALIASPQEIPEMPFLPLINAKNVFHADIQYLDFQTGKGLRYLTQLAQGMVPINNRELFYTYQGITNDGKYYVAAVLPVNNASLPADEQMTEEKAQELTSNYLQYLAAVEGTLDTQAPDRFNPDLTQLDAMMSSLKVQ